QAVVLVPAVVERGLVLVVPGGQRERALPHAVAGVVGQVGGDAVRLPVAGAARRRLQVSGHGHGGRRRRVVRGGGRDQEQRGDCERSGERLHVVSPLSSAKSVP